MADRRERNVQIFKDTERRYCSDKKLIEAITTSKEQQQLIVEKETVAYTHKSKEKKADIIVSGKRTLEAASAYAKAGKKTCILNFASATNPGGGVTSGSSAQEESICRISTLYPCISTDEMWELFYLPHRKAHNPLYNNDCIYTPDVCVFKSDTNYPEILPESDWWNVNVITCAAPNLRANPSNAMNPCAGSKAAKITEEEHKKLLKGRIKRIFEVAVKNGNEVLILGAFGCGAFRNPPKVVASVFREVMQEFLNDFEVVEYAVFHTEREKGNYEAFCEEI